MHKPSVLSAAFAIVIAGIAFGDEVIFNNGDKLTGKIITVDGGKMKIESKVAGEITVDMADVKTFTTDTPIQIKTAAPGTTSQKVTAGEAGQVVLPDGKALPLTEVKKINPPAQVWTGNVVVNGAYAIGNTNTKDLGIAFLAGLRRNDEVENDRFTLTGAYNLGITGRDVEVTTTDNWNVGGQYDKFWNEKFYTYGRMKGEHDRIGGIYYRLSPGIGLGYQWIEQADMHYSTEAGLTYVYQEFYDGDTEDAIAGRLAHHFDKKLRDNISVFHNAEWIPAFEDPSEYQANMDAGIRFDLSKTFFTQFKVEYKRNTVPPDGSFKNDLRYTVGVGWAF